MHKVCAIDIGTNSIRMLIAKIEKGRIIESYKDLESTRIGEKVDKTKLLSDEAMKRSIAALKRFVDRCKNEGIERIPIVATSAVRDAKNNHVFIEQVKKEIGVDVEVIDGDTEAKLGFLGVLKGLKERANILVIDIGGGSTEFIYGNGQGIRYMTSLNVGAVRMTEKFVKTDPISISDQKNMTNEIEKIINDTINQLKKYPIDQIIGIGGTATSIVAINQKLQIYDREKIHNYHLIYKDIQKIFKDISSKNLYEIRKTPGLHPKRADIIVAGTLILERILYLLKKESIIISEYDNLEGLVFKQMG